ncbi:MAG: inner membrane protein [Halopseudomonas sp.]|jgi:inner membrane protein|uniref:metal-dependent hydrolase n=1 Tax=Halopseudomonas sp. TaxID=2901191 RepID=UPI0039E505A7
MDSISQAVLGASIGGAMLGRWHGRKALLIGAALGTLPDMDVVLDFGDAVADMTYHRGFSHSLFFLTGLSLMFAWFVRRWRPHPDYSAMRLWLSIWLILVTHVLLDAFTSYGTQLFWPLTSAPVAISSIFIIDPLYTLPLLIAVIVALSIGLGRTGLRWQLAALTISTLYLLSSLAGKQMADYRLDQALARGEIETTRRFSSPTPFNTLLWRVVAVDGDDYYEGLTGWLDSDLPELEKLPRGYSHAAPALEGSVQHQRLRWFTRDILRYDLIEGQWVVTDLRLGMSGYHPFRFALATITEPQGKSELIQEVEQWPTPRADFSRIENLFRRAVDSSYRLSLRDLASTLGDPPLR